MFLRKHIALKTTHKSGISIHAALPLLSEKISSISPQIILPVYETIKLFPWFLIGQLETRRVKLLRRKPITYVEWIPHVLISIPSVNVMGFRPFRPNYSTCTAHLYLYCTLLVPHFTCTAHLCLIYKALMYIFSLRNTIQFSSISNMVSEPLL